MKNKAIESFQKHLPKHVQARFKQNGWRLNTFTKLLPDAIARGCVYSLTVPTKSKRSSIQYLYMPQNSEILPHINTATVYIGERHAKRKHVTICPIGKEHSIEPKEKTRVLKVVKIAPPREKNPSISKQRTFNFDK